MSAQNTRDILSKYGLANSAFGARVLAEETAQQNQNVANVPANETERILGQAPQESQAVTDEGAGLLGTAGGLDINQSWSDTASSMNESLKFSDIMKAFAASGGGGASPSA